MQLSNEFQLQTSIKALHFTLVGRYVKSRTKDWLSGILITPGKQII